MAKKNLPCPECAGATYVSGHSKRMGRFGETYFNPYRLTRYRQCKDCGKRWRTVERFIGFDKEEKEWDEAERQAKLKAKRRFKGKRV